MGMGDVFGFANVWVRPDPYPEAGSTFEVARSVSFGVRVSGQDGAGLPTAARPRLSAITWFADKPDLVTFGSTTTTIANGVESALSSFTCQAPGDVVIGARATIDPQVISDLIASLGLGEQPTDEFTFATSIHCGGPIGGFQPRLEAGCVSVIHQALSSQYPSYLHWLFGFAADPAFPSGAMLDLAYREGASGPVMRFGDIPIVGGRASADTGITQFGEKLFVDSHVSWSDGSQLNSVLLTEADWDAVFGLSFTVGAPEEILAGNACQ
jgi:hypothetical protein